jgi:hypothetical protein
MGLSEDALSVLFGPCSLREEEEIEKERRKGREKRKGIFFQTSKFLERKIKDNL